MMHELSKDRTYDMHGTMKISDYAYRPVPTLHISGKGLAKFKPMCTQVNFG